MTHPLDFDGHFVGVDMGGTRVKLGLWPANRSPSEATVERFRELPTGAHRGAQHVLDDVAQAVRALVEEAGAQAQRVVGLGVGIPAALSREGRIEVLPNFAPGWTGLDLAEELSGATGLSTAILNDARAFTLAEATLGAAAGAHAALGVTLGTGVGGGLVLSGRLYLGPSGKAGELGHQVVQPNGVLCGCGSHGCLETVASATALIASVTRSYLQGSTPLLRELTANRIEAITPALVARAAVAGDPVCGEAIERAGTYLGLAIANVTTLLAIDAVVVGGGMAGLGQALFGPLRRSLAAYAPVVGSDLPQVRRALLGDRAGVIGAAMHAAQKL